MYQNLVNLSRRYVLVCEYYNPAPVTVPYRGHQDRLFKRDFAGELMDGFGLELVDYGFVYRRDNHAAMDDFTWFLLRKGDLILRILLLGATGLAGQAFHRAAKDRGYGRPVRRTIR